MNIAGLIDILKTYDPNNIVMVDGYENGLAAVKPFRIRAVRFNKNEGADWWEGGLKEDSRGKFSGVVIGR